MAASSIFSYIVALLLVCQTFAAPLSTSKSNPTCTFAQLVAPGPGGLVYNYKTEVKLSVANGQFDLKTDISADVHIKSVSDCTYLLQLRNVEISETQDEDKKTVTSAAQRDLENLVTRFRWIDGFVAAVEVDQSARADYVNFIKGILSAIQVLPPVPTDNEATVREEDVLGVCTTQYKYSQKGGALEIFKRKDLSTCSKDKLHLSSSPVLTSLLGPLVEEVFSAKTHYVCQTNIRDKKVQSVKCKTIEIEEQDDRKPSNKRTDKDHIHEDDSSSEESDEVDFDDKEDEEISSKLISIKQELKLLSGAANNIDAGAIQNSIRQTLQFAPTSTFDKSTETVASLVSQVQGLLKSEDWNNFAASHFVNVANELRRFNKVGLNSFKTNADLKHLIPTLLNTVYSHDPSSTSVNFDPNTLTFANPLAVFYLDNPSTDLVEQIVQAAGQLTVDKVPEFVGPAAAILKNYKEREDRNKDANAKIREFQRAISKFLRTSGNDQSTTAVLSAYAQLGLYDDGVRALAADDKAPLEVQYHALNAIRHISSEYVADNAEARIRSELQNALLLKLQNKDNKNAPRIWAFEALYNPFILNPEETDSTLSDSLEKAFASILDEPLNQVNGYIWSVLKYSSLDRLCPLRGVAARLRTYHSNKKQYLEQATLSSRHIQLDLPLRKNYRAVLHLSVIFENDRAVPSYINGKIAFDGIRRETIRLPWVDAALIIENLDWNFADYILRLDPLSQNRDTSDDYKEKAKKKLPPGLKRLQDEQDAKEEDPDPEVHLYLKLFGADVRARDVTNKVQDLLRSNIRTFVQNQIINRLKELTGKNPVFRIPLEIGAASAAANGLTLYKSAQVGILADLTNEFENTRDSTGAGTFRLANKGAISLSLTLQREVSSTFASVGETIQIGVLSNVPFEYKAVAGQEGRTREFNLLEPQAKVLSTDFQYSVRTSKGLKAVPNSKTTSIDPSCTPTVVYRTLGIKACLELNPFRSIQLGSRPSYPITVTVSKDPSVKKWRIGWRFNAQDAPQYEVAVEKVGATGTYPGLGISATKTGNNFNIKVLTGMKSFNVKGTQNGNKFDGQIFSDENKEVMTTSGTLSIDSNGFKLDSKLSDSATRKQVAQLKADILPNRGKGLQADIELSAPDGTKSFKVHFLGDIYKEDSKLIHVDGSFNLGETIYSGKAHVESNDDHTLIELHRSLKLGRGGAPSGYEFFYERKNNKGSQENNYKIASHLSLQTVARGESIKVYNLKADFTRSTDLANAALQSSLDFALLTRSPPVDERIELDYVRRSVKTNNQARRLVSPEANLKIQLKTKSGVFNFLVDHRHRRSTEASKKGTVVLPPTLDINNKIHIAADSDKLLPDIPRPFAFDVLSELEFQILNEIKYKLQYNLPRRQRSAKFSYEAQIDRVIDNHLFVGNSKSELEWDNKQKHATATGTFSVCTRSRSLKSHWDIDTNMVTDRNDAQLDIFARFDRQPKRFSPKSIIGVYNISFRAPKHEILQLVDLEGNFTRQVGKLETFNSVAYRLDKVLKELNFDAAISRNQTGDGSTQTHVTISLPFKNIPYITHDLKVERNSPNGRIKHIASTLLAQPVLAHYATICIERSDDVQPPWVTVQNELEYLRANGDTLHGLSLVNVHRWSKLHSFGFLKRNTVFLHKHSIGYIFSLKTRKIALSIESPQLPGNPLSLIGELTIDRENRIGKLNWPQEFGIHIEVGTPLSNLTAFQAFYNFPMFRKDADRTVDGTVGLKIASPKITPISFYAHAKGSLNTTLHVKEAINIGDDIAFNTILTAQYNPQAVHQLSHLTSSKFYDKEFQNSFYILVKNHQAVIRGILNTTDNEDYQYDMDISFDNDLLTGHTERTDGKQKTVSDIDAKKCAPTGQYSRCYKGEITIQKGSSGASERGTFDVSWGRETAKLQVRVPSHIELNFDHTHNGRIRDEDFISKTVIEGKSLRTDNQLGFSYSGSIEKEDGKWNVVQVRSSLNDKKTGEKRLNSVFNLNNKILNKLTGEFERKIAVSLEQKGITLIDWSSKAVNCKDNPSNVLSGICETATFNLKASNALAQRLRQRLELPADPRIANPAGFVTYDGTLNLDLKFDPRTGPHTAKLDVNRLKEDAVDVDASFQPRSASTPLNIRLKANLPRQKAISIKYDEVRRSATNYQGTLKYSLNANDGSSEKTLQCEFDRPDPTDVSINCQGERTKLVIDFDRQQGKSKAYIELLRFQDERFGYEAARDPQTNALDVTLYNLASSWNIRRQPGQSTTVTVTQKGREVLRVEGIKVGSQQIQLKFSPANVNLELEWNNSTVVTLKQTAPEQRNLLALTIDRARIRPYLPSLRNQNRPSVDIDQQLIASRKPLVELALDSHIVLSLSQALDKVGAYNGQFGLDSIKKLFRLQIGDAPLTVYNGQHWKLHREQSRLPESYTVRITNDANGNFVQLSTNKWNEDHLISEISHSFDGGKSSNSDLKLKRNYGHQVGSMYFLHSLGYRNIQGAKQLRNFTRQFVRNHLMESLKETNLQQLVQDFRKRLRSILDVDYAAFKEIVESWNKEPENSFLRQWSNRMGFSEFFAKYPTYTQASERISAIGRERLQQRVDFWRDRVESIMNDNRLQDLSERFLARRQALIKRLLDRAEPLLERLLPKVDQSTIDKRIADYVGKVLAALEQLARRNGEKWKSIFKAIDDATKGAENKWFRTLVADIDSDAFSAATDAELNKVFKKLGDSSKLLISNIQQISRRITKRREAIRERVKNAIRHLPKAYINETNFELLFPIGFQPGTYAGTSELLLGIGSLIRNRDQAFETMRAIIQNRLEARTESLQFYLKAIRSIAKRLFKRDPSLTPESTAVVTETGYALDVNGIYAHLNPACDYVLAHDFADLQFSFRFTNGKVYSLIPNQVEIEDYECSKSGRVQACNHGSYYTINVPMHYGGRVKGAFGDVRDRTGTEDLGRTRWLLKDCPAATRDLPRNDGQNIFECASDDDDEEKFCENYVADGLKNGKNRQVLVAHALEARKAAS